jgi:hypothetical protein
MSQFTRLLDFRGFLLETSGQKELIFWIEAPRRKPGESQFHCEIGASFLPRPMKIYGEDAKQAMKLAYAVVKKRLAGKTQLDSTGAPVALPSLPKS